jgi:periplasmic divalent cation tolerance protein
MAEPASALVLVTAPPDAAGELARTLVDERLAACVNRLDCRSTYRWDDAVHEDEEELLAIKTTPERVEDLRARVETLHPYDLPAIERVDATPTAATAEWVAGAVD